MHVHTDDVYPDINLGQVLNFFTGTDYPPPLGFDSPVRVYFDAETPLPMASTCALQLTIPTMYCDDKNKFEERMIYGFLNHGGFGMN